jgi:hypothetical protein
MSTHEKTRRPESLSAPEPDGKDVSDAPAPPTPPAPPMTPPMATAPAAGGLPMFIASCKNCTRFAAGNCDLGRILPPGKLLCGDYDITPAFRDELVSVMMKDILTQVKETAGRVQKLRAAQRLWN